MKKIQGLFYLFLIFMITGCEDTTPTLPPVIYAPEAYYPHVTTDTQYTSAIKIYNKSEYLMELNATYRTPDGNEVMTKSATLNPHESKEFIKANFTGSVQLNALSDIAALRTHLETRRNDNKGAALAHKAKQLDYPWFYLLGITDFGVGDVRSSIIMGNPWHLAPIDYHILPVGTVGCAGVVARGQLQPYQVLIFNPSDVFQNRFDEEAFYIDADSTQYPDVDFGNFAGAHFIESPNGNIGLFNYRRKWQHNTTTYLVDIQDNATRQDKILLKWNGLVQHYGMPLVFKQYALHFYDYSGVEVAGSPCKVSLAQNAFAPESYNVFSPRELLGHSFSGSVWIDPPSHLGIKVRRFEVGIIKQVPGYWRDITDYSLSAHSSTGGGAIAHTTTDDPGWHYRLLLYYPRSDYEPDPDSDPGAEETGDIFFDPGTEPPKVTGGQVILKFHSKTGNYLGSLGIFMNPNETRHIDIDSISEIYLNGHFTGSIEFIPNIAHQLETWHDSGYAHGSTGTWGDAPYF